MFKYIFPLSIAAMVLTGCQPTTPPPTSAIAPPYSMRQFTQLRDQIQHTHPDYRVGLVTDVLPEGHLAAIGNTQVEDYKQGDLISFYDSNNQLVTNGVVQGTQNGVVSVQYADPGPGGRIPARGDLAIRAIQAAQ